MANSAGGFFSPLLSPPASTTSQATSVLPAARATPLKPGSPKAEKLLNYVESHLQMIGSKYERRFGNRVQLTGSSNQLKRKEVGKGYSSLGELVADMDGLVDVLWVSSTTSLQIPFLISIALAFNEYLPSFPFTPYRLFPFLHKLDLAFASLLRGSDMESNLPLPDSFRRPVRMTEKVRLRGIIESSRLAVMDSIKRSGSNTSGIVEENSMGDDAKTETDDEATVTSAIGGNDTVDDWELDAARVYELTMTELGKSLDTLLLPISGIEGTSI